MYRLYKKKLNGSYDNEIVYKNTLEEIEKEAERISPKEYFSYLIIENDGESDRVVTMHEFYKPVKIEETDKDETSIEVKAKVFKMSRTKQKQEFRKQTEEYYR